MSITRKAAAYRAQDLVRPAKRDNNKKRSFLLVNPLQGKHVPCSPRTALCLFHDLAQQLNDLAKDETLLIIGFAETATAIGAAIAACRPDHAFYIQTTREFMSDADYLFFSETHSHAAEQKLVKNRLSDMLRQADRVIFAEDEVTTGNTILNAIDAICREYGALDLKFGVISILNGMSAENLENFRRRNIACTCLLPLEKRNYEEHLSRYEYDPLLCIQPEPAALPSQLQAADDVLVSGYSNPRLGGSMKEYLDSCHLLVKAVTEQIHVKDLEGKDVLVLGTEEFMFPPLLLAGALEGRYRCASVRFHATTRSPILPCGAEDYPVFSRISLRSVYDPARPTFIYNLRKYDKVLILHDSPKQYDPGLLDLRTALAQHGCQDISVYRWGDEQ